MIELLLLLLVYRRAYPDPLLTQLMDEAYRYILHHSPVQPFGSLHFKEYRQMFQRMAACCLYRIFPKA
jgi:hypothetical protein